MREEEKDQPFGEWIWKQLKGWGAALAVVAALGTAFNFALPVLSLPASARTPALYATQFVVIAIIAGVIAFRSKHRFPVLHPRHPKHGEVRRGADAVKQFWRWFTLLWCVWALLYMLLTGSAAYFNQRADSTEQAEAKAAQDRREKTKNALKAMAEQAAQTDGAERLRVVEDFMNKADAEEERNRQDRQGKKREGDRETARVLIALHVLNNTATLILLMLFHILARPSVPEPQGGEPARGQGDEGTPDSPPAEDKAAAEAEAGQLDHTAGKLAFWIIAFVAFTAGEVALVGFGEKVGFDGDPATWSQVFGVFYGVIAAMATALVVGQLDSVLLKVPFAALVVLFIYAAIQPTFELLLEPSKAGAKAVAADVIAATALISKIVLFTITRWLLKTNRLLYYMVRAYHNFKKADEDRDEFFRSIGLADAPSKQ